MRHAGPIVGAGIGGGAADQEDVVDEAGQRVELSIADGAAADHEAALVRAVQPRGAAAGQDRRRAGASGEWASSTCRIGKAAGGEPRGAATVGPVRYQKMREPRIGRLVIAALHQAIAEALPLRLEFYENWLKPLGLLREGKHIGPAPFSAALSFLRREDVGLYDSITGRAGVLAADWRADFLRWSGRRWARSAAGMVAQPIGAAGDAPHQPRRLSEHARALPRPEAAKRASRSPGRPSARCASRSTGRCARFYAGVVRRLMAAYGLAATVRLESVPGHGRQGVRADRDLAAR